MEEYGQKYVKSSPEKEVKRKEEVKENLKGNDKKAVHQVKSQKTVTTKFMTENDHESHKRESLPDPKKLLSTPISQKIVKNQNVFKLKAKMNPQSDNKVYKSSFTETEKKNNESKFIYSPEKITFTKATLHLPETPIANITLKEANKIRSTQITYPENIQNKDIFEDSKNFHELVNSINSPQNHLLSSENINRMNSGLNMLNSQTDEFEISNATSYSVSTYSDPKKTDTNPNEQEVKYTDSANKTFPTKECSDFDLNNMKKDTDSPFMYKTNRESKTLEHTTRKTSDFMYGNFDIRNQLVSRSTQRTMSNTIPFDQYKIHNKV